MNRMTLIKIHMLLAAFMLPAALMFLITGGLYTWEVKGSYLTEDYTVTLQEPLQKDLDQLVDIASAELDARSIAHPTGKAKIKTIGPAYQLEWTGSGLDILLVPSSDPLAATLSVKKTTWYRNLVQLHKAKGGTPFKIYAAMLAVALLVILLSGVILSWQVPKLRQTTVIAIVAGFASFGLLVMIS